MPNLRLIHDNAADRATSLAASTTAGALVAAYLQNDFKGQAHRSTGTSMSYTLTWTAGETVGAVALPATNLSASATIRVRLYSDTGGTTLIADSGTVNACPGLNLGLWNWSLPINGNAFAFGGASKSAVWFSAHYFARRCVIDLVDTGKTLELIRGLCRQRDLGDVLIEKPGRKPGQLVGKSPWLQSVHVVAEGAKIGDMIEVEIVSAGPNSLAGELMRRKAA